MSWQEKPAFKNLDAQKKEIILDLIQESKGKALNQSFPILLNAQSRLRAKGISFTTEETNLLMDILTQDLSPSEKAKVDMMKTIISQEKSKSKST